MNRGIEVLQTCALPLGHGAVEFTLYYYSREFSVCQGEKAFFKNFIISAVFSPFQGMQTAPQAIPDFLTPLLFYAIMKPITQKAVLL